jgi:Protein of unknown function DUF262
MSKTIHPDLHPGAVKLEDLFQAIDQGTLRIPNFYGPFRWSEEDMRALFDSVLKGYPIGSLVFWEASGIVNFDSRNAWGPFAASRNHAPATFIIDGYHRLMTLYGVLKNDPVKEKRENRKFNIYLDLEQEQETLLHLNQPSSPSPTVVPLHSLWNSREYFKASEKLQASKADPSGSMLEMLRETYSELHRYKLSIIRMNGGNDDDLFAVFSKLNPEAQKPPKRD